MLWRDPHPNGAAIFRASQHHSMSALPPKADISAPVRQVGFMSTRPSIPPTPDDFAAAAEELRALLAPDSPPDRVDEFIDLVERLPTAAKRQASKWSAHTKA